MIQMLKQLIRNWRHRRYIKTLRGELIKNGQPFTQAVADMCRFTAMELQAVGWTFNEPSGVWIKPGNLTGLRVVSVDLAKGPDVCTSCYVEIDEAGTMTFHNCRPVCFGDPHDN